MSDLVATNPAGAPSTERQRMGAPCQPARRGVLANYSWDVAE
jgi:hypothetical protein